MDVLPPELLRRVVEACLAQDAATALPLLRTSRAIADLVMACARRRLLYRNAPTWTQRDWPSAQVKLIQAMAPPDLELHVNPPACWAYRHKLTPLYDAPPAPLWPLVSRLRLDRLHLKDKDLGAMRLHQWPQLQVLELVRCRVTLTRRAASQLALPPPRLHTLRVLQCDFRGRAAHVGAGDLLLPLARAAAGTLRTLGLPMDDDLLLEALRAAPGATAVELHDADTEDIEEVAQFSQLRHLTLRDTNGLRAYPPNEPWPFETLRIEDCSLPDLARLPVDRLERGITLSGYLWGVDGPDSAPGDNVPYLDRLLRMMLAGKTVEFDAESVGQDRHSHYWRLADGERLLELQCVDAPMVAFVLLSRSSRANAVSLSEPLGGAWEDVLGALATAPRRDVLAVAEAEAALEGGLLAGGGGGGGGAGARGGAAARSSGATGGGGGAPRVHTVCLWQPQLVPGLSKWIPPCIRHVKVACYKEGLQPDVLCPLIEGLPAHVESLTLLHKGEEGEEVAPGAAAATLAWLAEAGGRRGRRLAAGTPPLRLAVVAHANALWSSE